MSANNLSRLLIAMGLSAVQAVSFATETTPPISPQSQTESTLSKDVLRFNRELQIIKKEYVHPTSDHQLLRNAMQGMASGLDPHSGFLDAEDLKDLQTATTGQFSGLGLEVAMEEGLLHIITPLDDSPAKKAGIQPGDWILRINHQPVQGLTLREAVNKMRGNTGKVVHLTLFRKGLRKPFTVQLKCEAIQVQSVKGRWLSPHFAYIRIGSFQETTRKDLDKFLHALQENPNNSLQGLILDLRNNPGGLLTTAAEVANAFLDSKQMQYQQLLVYTQGNTPQANMRIVAKDHDQKYKGALVVLINQGTASGAEIVAGALQDNQRAVVVGTKSFGKGSVQSVIPLDEISALKLTTALYYTPSGRSIQAAGIVPDITLNELKVNFLDERGLDAIYLHESELKGHLSNNKNQPVNQKTSLEPSSAIETNELLRNDYQLFEAFNVLKSLVVLQNTANKA